MSFPAHLICIAETQRPLAFAGGRISLREKAQPVQRTIQQAVCPPASVADTVYRVALPLASTASTAADPQPSAEISCGSGPVFCKFVLNYGAVCSTMKETSLPGPQRKGRTTTEGEVDELAGTELCH